MYWSSDPVEGIRRLLDSALLYIESNIERDSRYIFDAERFEAALEQWAQDMRSYRDRNLALERMVLEASGRISAQQAQIIYLKAMLEMTPQNPQ